ncbi:MAG: RdgB/HAM1 family non-canonical purine NTP pyrophosphatase [Anaerolineae bacterium]|nr:RdgB/HAM1 family non-canonical purine NTP pyrophosphatase [Anaerolineae bacterium]
MYHTLLLATRNEGKKEELAALLVDLDIDCISLADLEARGITTTPVAETGTSFEENAILKAEGYARQTGFLTLADDSGLEVKALGGRPGVQTARYGGDGLSSVERYHYLLAQMREVPAPDRSARFCCVVAVASAQGVLATAEGGVRGRIAHEPRGDAGFGYDPVFVVRDYGKTMAELPAETKNRISHRARAIAALKPELLRLLAG